jgi:hypothetical protein
MLKKQNHKHHTKKGTFIIRVFNTQTVCSTASLRMVAVMGCPGGYKLYMQ